MMTANEVMAELKTAGSDKIKSILLKHGVKEPFFGVKVEDLKIIQKKTGKSYELAKELYATGNADAMYLAGLITDDTKMSKADLQDWVKRAVSNNINEYTVPWVTAGNPYGYELALQWIDDEDEYIATAGWATLSNLVALKPDSELAIDQFKALLDRVEKTIHSSQNRVRSVMNNFIISLGSYVTPLTDAAIAAAERIGPVMVDKGDTACKVPSAITYIQKVKDRGSLGKKKKTVKC
ncbi:MAG TPA: DNA alkylation repair protein [Mucilaginibacter sp.]|jgi:3-methyladenine DNA glycosylase AlkD|nr:DNA alkylation repair protein [Mucilaginibacter sp.]